MNTAAMASFRAPGHVEGAFGLECAMDVLARELEIDPLELRRRNYADHDQEKEPPVLRTSISTSATRLGAERFGWDARSARESAIERGALRRGVGMASLTWGAGGGPPAYATVRINRDGSVEVLTGAQDLGTGARTVLAQIAAEVLGAKLEDVRTVLGDTERLPFASNSWGSITTASVGPAVRVARRGGARRAVRGGGGNARHCSRDDLESRDSEIHAKSSDRCMLFRGRVREARRRDDHRPRKPRAEPGEDGDIARSGRNSPRSKLILETGRVRVLRIVSAHDSGRIVNPTLAESQLEGGIIQGIGYALFEERVLDARFGTAAQPDDARVQDSDDGGRAGDRRVLCRHSGYGRQSHRSEGRGGAADHCDGAGDRECGGGCARGRGEGDSDDAVESPGGTDLVTAQRRCWRWSAASAGGWLAAAGGALGCWPALGRSSS